MKTAKLNYLWFVCIYFFVNCSVTGDRPVDFSNGSIVAEWNSVLSETIIQDLFSPPVASRIYVYPNLAAYEVLKFSQPGKRSVVANLNGFDSISPPVSRKINLSVSALKAFTTVALKLVYSENKLNQYYSQTIDSLIKTGISKEIITESESYGNAVAQKILNRASNDMFRQTRGMTRYTLKNTPGSWEPTPPDYMQGVEPNWQLIRPLVLDSCAMFCPDSILPFDENKNSVFEAAAREVMEVSAVLDSEKISIIRFWDDNPNVSSHFGHATFFEQKLTPGGHWMAITSKVIKDKKLSQPEAAYTFALTAVALYDGFVACWQAKYNYSTIRPVTYIQKYIDSDWNPFLQTPPFPEFPSGHSTISASAAAVLTGLFGDNYAFTDSSEVPYGLPVRSFESFYDASDEAAMSRLYGGIHFRWGNDAGAILGRQVGNLVLLKMNQSLLTTNDSLK